ncbi:MAG: aldo/keto reductase [bacterium]|nr:aldo/keto reductase [bacterium]
MTYRPLARNASVKVSPFALGTGFRAHADDKTCENVLNRAIDLGCNFIDCANFYGRGRSETIVGNVARGKRDDLIITSKVWSSIGEGPNDRGLSAFHIMREVERSLRRLQTDHIDIYLLHHVDPESRLEETLRAFDTLVQQGKVRYTGCCNHTGALVTEALWIADKHNYAPYACIQNPYNLLERYKMEEELMPVTDKFGLGIMTYSPLAVGLLTGQFRRGQPLTGSWARRQDRFDAYMTDQTDAVIQSVVDIAAEHGATPAQIAIAWLLTHDNIVPILGPDHPDQVDDVFGALDIQLSTEQREKLDSVSQPPEIQHIA